MRFGLSKDARPPVRQGSVFLSGGLNLHPSAGLCGFFDCFQNPLVVEAVMEGRLHGFSGDGVHEGVLVADDVAGGPPFAHTPNSRT